MLVAAAQRGERDALEELLRRHYDRIFTVCRRVVQHDADAYDAAQNALLAVSRGLPNFDGTSSFTTWMHRVATNAALDELRRRKRRPEPTSFGVDASRTGSSDSGSGPSAPKEPGSLDRHLESVDDRADIDQALRRLPVEFRTPLVLRDLCGLDYAEIAETLQIPAGTVRSRIARGRAALAPLLEPRPTAHGQPATAQAENTGNSPRGREPERGSHTSKEAP